MPESVAYVSAIGGSIFNPSYIICGGVFTHTFFYTHFYPILAQYHI